MDWKVIIALAILILPMAYCTLEVEKSEAEQKIKCTENRGVWSTWGGGSCVFE